MKTFKRTQAEAAEFNIQIIQHGVYLRFVAPDGRILAWMTKFGAEWKGYTCEPDITGRKTGAKGEVANWCLDWAVNGF